MVRSKAVEEIARKIQAAFPDGAGRLQDDFKRNAREAISSALGRMELVPREEFDLQTDLLERARQRIVELERRVSDLEGEILKPSARAAPGPGGAPR